MACTGYQVYPMVGWGAVGFFSAGCAYVGGASASFNLREVRPRDQEGIGGAAMSFVLFFLALSFWGGGRCCGAHYIDGRRGALMTLPKSTGAAFTLGFGLERYFKWR